MYIAPSTADAAVVNPNGIKKPLAYDLSTLFYKRQTSF